MYDNTTIAQIKTNIETGSAESIGYSIELLDLFVEESIKPNLFIILEYGSEINKIQYLQSEYPIEILREENIIHAILNRDHNYLDTHTLILAIEETSKISGYKVDNNLIAHLFNPDLLVAEITAQHMFLLNKELLFSIFPRLGEARRTEIELYISKLGEKANGSYLNIFEILKSTSLSELISSYSLFQISRLFKQFELINGEEFSLELIHSQDYFLHFPEGSLELVGEKGQFKLDSESEFHRLRESDIGGFDNLKISSDGDMSLLIMNGEDLKELIFDNEDIFLKVLDLFLKELNILR